MLGIGDPPVSREGIKAGEADYPAIVLGGNNLAPDRVGDVEVEAVDSTANLAGLALRLRRTPPDLGDLAFASNAETHATSPRLLSVDAAENFTALRTSGTLRASSERRLPL
jgi:hypothetical protein